MIDIQTFELHYLTVIKASAASERQARCTVSTRMDKGVLVSDNSRAPLRLVFPASLASRWMPGLFPEHAA
jgi:hypothetical protein